MTVMSVLEILIGNRPRTDPGEWTLRHRDVEAALARAVASRFGRFFKRRGRRRTRGRTGFDAFLQREKTPVEH